VCKLGISLRKDVDVAWNIYAEWVRFYECVDGRIKLFWRILVLKVYSRIIQWWWISALPNLVGLHFMCCVVLFGSDYVPTCWLLPLQLAENGHLSIHF